MFECTSISKVCPSAVTSIPLIGVEGPRVVYWDRFGRPQGSPLQSVPNQPPAPKRL